MLALSRIREFFQERFTLKENVLWRIMVLLKAYKRWIIIANLCVFLAQMLSMGGLIGLQPLFSRALGPEATAQMGGFGKAKASFSNLTGTGTTPATPEDKTNGTGKSRKQVREAKETSKQLKQFHQRPGLLSRLNLFGDTPTSGTVANPGALARARNAVIARWQTFATWANASTGRFVTLYALFLITLLVINGIFQFLGDFLMAKVSTEVTSDMMRSVYGNVLLQELNFFNCQTTGNLLNTCYREIFDLQAIIQFLASQRIMVPIQMATYFCGLLYISWQLSLMLLVMLPLIILPTFILTRRIKHSLSKEIDEETGAMDVMAQGFHGILAIKAFGAERLETKYLDSPIDAYIRFSRARRAAQAFIGPVVDVLNMAVLLILFSVSVFLYSRHLLHHLDAPKLICFMFMITQFYKPMRDIMTMNVRMQRARAMARRIFTLMDRKPEIGDAEAAVDFPKPWHEMVFDHIYLTYHTMRKGQERVRRALIDVKIRIRRGEAIAVIGPNGAGKSSMVNLICRLYDPTGGRLLIDGTPLSDIKLKHIREQICLITQHPILFNRTVAENIAFGLEDAPRAEIIKAAKASGAHDFIMSLPQDYDSYVGEQGRLLSGGERQKIVLARAFIRKPQILILDEPTTGLDRETTAEFLDLVSRLHKEGMTIIYITHEHTQLSRFERVFQLTPDKRIVEVENHAGLKATIATASTVGDAAS